MTEENKAIEDYKRVIAMYFKYSDYDLFCSNLMKSGVKGTIQNTMADMVNLIEKLQKENEELNKQYDQLTQYFVKNHVAKDKIREIIEKLENEEKTLRKDCEKHRVQLFELYKKVVLIEGYKKLLEEE